MEGQISLNQLKPVKSESIDLGKFHNEKIIIESAEITQVPSKYSAVDASGRNLPQWVLKVSSPVLVAVGEGEDKIEFRASELFNLVQDKEGKLVGYPESPDSNLGKFMKDIRATTPQDIVGKVATVKAWDKEVEGNKRTYLKFKY